MKTYSAKQTKAIAAKMAKILRGGEVIALQGDLGSGKTTFVQGLAHALGVRRSVRSPTFTIMQCFDTRPTTIASPPGRTKQSHRRSPRPLRGLAMVRRLCHVDAYRLDPQADFGDLGLQDYLGKPDTVTVIEWPERIRGLLPKKMVWVKFGHGKKENERKITRTK